MRKDFAIFILSHGRPESIVTIPVLERSGYTGDIYIVCDDGDKTLDKYKELYGDKVKVFNKAEQSDFDLMDSLDDDRCVVFARNYTFKLAKELGYKYFAELDDDYNHFNYRFDDNYKYISSTPIRGLDKILTSMVEYVESSPIHAICFAQGGDFIGGKSGGMAQAVQTKRKAMNLFVFDVDRPVEFTGRINEDVNMYLRHGILGDILLTTTQVCLEQVATQTGGSGLTDIYKALGTYVKSFYSVMASPSSVKINLMGNKHRRLHHIIKWNNTVPKIIRQEHQKSVV